MFGGHVQLDRRTVERGKRAAHGAAQWTGNTVDVSNVLGELVFFFAGVVNGRTLVVAEGAPLDDGWYSISVGGRRRRGVRKYLEDDTELSAPAVLVTQVVPEIFRRLGLELGTQMTAAQDRLQSDVVVVVVKIGARCRQIVVQMTYREVLAAPEHRHFETGRRRGRRVFTVARRHGGVRERLASGEPPRCRRVVTCVAAWLW